MKNHLINSVKSLLEISDCFIANAANVSSFIFNEIENLNWAGFYFIDNDKLLLGPFSGRPACVYLPYGKGVCWKAALDKSTAVVNDVHAFPDHIACDSASQSEIVVPLICDGRVIGVLDIDSPVINRFGEDEKIFFEEVSQIYLRSINISKLKSYYSL